jgi:hypothetical protein
MKSGMQAVGGAIDYTATSSITVALKFAILRPFCGRRLPGRPALKI